MIRSFADKETLKLWETERSVRLQTIARESLRRLIQLNAAENLEDLRMPPGNRLEVLSGNREGFHSIRINQQWRICFRWTTSGPEDVEIVDYH